jgi:hypothetical protein
MNIAVVNNSGVVTFLNTGIVTITYTVTDSITTCTNFATHTINVMNAPQLNITNHNQVVCAGTPILIPNGLVSNWSSLNLVVTDTNTGNVISNGTFYQIDTTTVFSITAISSSSCSITDFVTITVNPLPNFLFIDNQTGINDTITIDNPLEVCYGSTINLVNYIDNQATMLAAGYTYQYYLNNGIVIANTIVTPTADTTIYRVRLIGPAPLYCSGEEHLFYVVVNPKPQIVINNDIPVVCVNGANFTLNTTVNGTPDNTGTWTSSNPAVIAVNPLNEFVIVGVGSATLTYTFVNATGCSNSESTTITVVPQPTLTAVQDFSVCPNTSITIPNDLVINYQNGMTLYVYNNVTGILIDSVNSTATLQIPITQNTTFRIEAKNASGCATNPVYVNVSVYQLPSFTWTDGSVNYAITQCTNTTVDLAQFINNAAQLIGEGYSYIFYTDNGISLGTTIVSPTGTTTYHVVLRGPAPLYCVGNDTLNITVNVETLPTVANNPIQSVDECSGQPFIVHFPTVAGVTYDWSYSQSESNDNGLITAVIGTADTNVTQINVPSGIMNFGGSALTATFYAIPHTANCTGEPIKFTITIEPRVTISVPAVSHTACSGQPFDLPITVSKNGLGVTWVRYPVNGSCITDTVAGIAGISENNLVVLNDNGLVNLCNNPTPVIYIITVHNGGCAMSDTIIVNVTPKAPDFTFSSTETDGVQAICASDQVFGLDVHVTDSSPKNYQYMATIVRVADSKEIYSVRGLISNSNAHIDFPISTLSSGLYYAIVTVYSSNGCVLITNTVLLAVTGQIGSMVTPGAQDTVVACINNKAEVFSHYIYVPANASWTYQWYRNGTAIAGATSNAYTATEVGIYSVFVTTPCDSTGSSVIVANITSDCGYTGCLANVLQLWDDPQVGVLYVDNSNNLFVAYQWYINSQPITNAIHQQYDTHGQGGNYEVMAQTSDGVWHWVCGSFQIKGAKVISFNLYPNPANQNSEVTVYIENDDINLDDITIELVDVLGQILGRYKVTSNYTYIDAPMSIGTYVVRLMNNDGTALYTRKLIIK